MSVCLSVYAAPSSLGAAPTHAGLAGGLWAHHCAGDLYLFCGHQSRAYCAGACHSIYGASLDGDCRGTLAQASAITRHVLLALLLALSGVVLVTGLLEQRLGAWM